MNKKKDNKANPDVPQLPDKDISKVNIPIIDIVDFENDIKKFFDKYDKKVKDSELKELSNLDPESKEIKNEEEHDLSRSERKDKLKDAKQQREHRERYAKLTHEFLVWWSTRYWVFIWLYVFVYPLYKYVALPKIAECLNVKLKEEILSFTWNIVYSLTGATIVVVGVYTVIIHGLFPNKSLVHNKKDKK